MEAALVRQDLLAARARSTELEGAMGGLVERLSANREGRNKKGDDVGEAHMWLVVLRGALEDLHQFWTTLEQARLTPSNQRLDALWLGIAAARARNSLATP